MGRIPLRPLLQPLAVATFFAAGLVLLLPPRAGADPAPAIQVITQPSATPVTPQPAATQPGAAQALQRTPEEQANLLMAQRHYQAAIEAYKKAPTDSAPVWNKMGIAYQAMLMPNQAMHCYLTAFKLDPKNGDVLNNLGTVYVSFKDYRTAERYYRKALKLEPTSAIIFKNLGTDLLMRRKYKKGGQMYAKAVAIDPLIFQAGSGYSVADPTPTQTRGAMNYYMAKTCARAGMKGSAVEYLRKALDEGYTNPQKIAADGEFASLRGLPAFEQLLAEQKQHP